MGSLITGGAGFLQEKKPAARQTQLDSLETYEALSATSPVVLAQEVMTLREQRDRADMAAIQAGQVIARRVALSGQFQHAEAFMLMTYVSEGGQLVKKIWNSRDGVTPLCMVIDNVKYTHQLRAMQGPFFDRPEACEAQWETRTVRSMMEAWGRSLDRAVLLGNMASAKAEANRHDAEAAKSWNLHIGLRSLESGKYTDEL